MHVCDVYICVNTFVFVHGMVCVWGSESNLRCWSSTFTLFQMGSHVYCCALKVGWPESFQGFSCLCLPSHHGWFTASYFMWVPGRLNLCPHTCTANILHIFSYLRNRILVCVSVWLLGIVSLFHSSGGLWMIVVRSRGSLKTRGPSEASEADP